MLNTILNTTRFASPRRLHKFIFLIKSFTKYCLKNLLILAAASRVNQLAKASVAIDRSGPIGTKGQKLVKLIDFSYFYQISMTKLQTFGPHRPGEAILAAKASASRLTSLAAAA